VLNKGGGGLSNYASLQLLLDEHMEAARERIIYVITAYMDAHGMMPCGRESAERTVAFAYTPDGWAVFDDDADRLDIPSLDGIGRCLTMKLRTKAIGVMGLGENRMLRLYHDGRLLDTYITSTGVFGKVFCKIGCRGHAIRWRIVLREQHTIKELSAAFLQGQKEPALGFKQLRQLLCLGDTAAYGFASIEDAGLQGVVTLYFCATNHVRQHWLSRLMKPACAARTLTGLLFRRARCRQWQ
jgi:hypothetical protein